MANPQAENGHIKIACELGEALCRINLTAHENRILWCILRKTYGWNKKTDRISYSQFQESTGIDRRHIGRTLATLKARQIIICRGEGYSLEYGLQKDYELWKRFDTIPGAKFDTIPGNDLTPSEATIPEDICHHPRAELTPSQGLLTPSQATNLTPSQGTTKAIKHINKSNIQKNIYGEFQNVLLTPLEFQKLVARFGETGAKEKIESLSSGMASKGYKFLSHYATILNWARRDGGNNGRTGKNSGNRGNLRSLPKSYTDPDDLRREATTNPSGKD